MNLTKTNWPSGWTPNADQVGGDPNGLLRMDNLQLEEGGAVSLVRGLLELTGSLPDWVYRMYSRLVNGVEFTWAALNVTGSSVVRTSNNFSSFTSILSAGGQRACFGEAFGKVLISCGLQRIKDDGTSTPQTLGLTSPVGASGTPKVNQINQQGLDMSDGYTFQASTPPLGTGFTVEGTDAALIFVDPVTLLGTFETEYPGGLDTIHFGVPGLNPDNDPGTDLFTMLWQPGNPTNFTTFTITFWLDATGVNTYYYTWNAQSDLLQGIDVQTVVSINRNQFIRTGADGTKGWQAVYKAVFSAQAIAVDKFLAGQQNFTGGAQGSLNADYQYVCVMVANNGLNGPYVAMSAPSPAAPVAVIYNGYASVQLPASTDPQVNQCWLYRKSIADSRGAAVAIPNYLLVAMSTPGAIVQDTMSDDDVLLQNIPLNPYLVSVKDLVDDIFSMEGLFNTRMLYATIQYVYLSDSLDPDCVDTRFTLKVSGDAAEHNLFIKALTNNTLILATTKDLYYISGTLTAAPDGTLDITVQAIGEAFPPLSSDFCFSEGMLFYIAADGLRYTTGSNSMKVPGMELLWQGMNRYGVPPVALVAGNQDEYSLTVGRGGKIYLALPMTDGTRRLIIYNTITQQWRLQYTDPVCVYATQTGLVLLGYNLSTVSKLSGGIFQLDVGYGIQNSDGSLNEGIPITLQTVCDANGQPRNRKDTFTLKVICDTGNMPVSIYVNIDNAGSDSVSGTTFQWVGDITHNGMSTAYFDMASFTLGFRYAFKIVDKNLLTYFKLNELTLEYDARPEQLDFKRVLNDNLGTISRKRFVNYAIVIDTLGNNVALSLIIDNTPVASDTINTSVKQTYIYYFTSETIGTDIGCSFTGGPFEFYALDLNEILSEKLPVPVKFLIIPANNYGSPQRKRHTSYKLQINTRGMNVIFTPLLDGTSYTPATFNTPTKETVQYYFPTNVDITGIDIGGTLAAATPFEFYGVITPQQIEELPPLLKSYYIPVTNLGTAARKRLKTIPIVINTFGYDVQFTLTVGSGNNITAFPSITLNTSYRETQYYFFTQDSIGVDFGCSLQSLNNQVFECYGLSLQDAIAETLPMPTEYMYIPPTNYGSPGRKRFTSFKFMIDTMEYPVIFTPILDGTSYPSATYTTNGPKTVEYFFNTSIDITGIDIGGTIATQFGNPPFEFYGVVIPEKVETLPPLLESLYLPVDNLGSVGRKRLKTIAFVINTFGINVNFALLVDGVSQATEVFNTNFKQTVYYFFNADLIGVDFAIQILGTQPFEFYGIDAAGCIHEAMPVPTEYLVIPPNNYGTPARKRHTSYKFQINTKGQPVTFTPIIDGILYPSTVYTTQDKKTVEYFFNYAWDVTGIDIGGTISSNMATSFEFYEVVTPEKIETLPPRLESFYIPFDNFGSAARKRIRTIPLIIYTYGQNVAYTPNIDGISYPTKIFNTTYKQTVYYFFATDMFGIDVGGSLVTFGTPAQPFEFYGFGTPEDVEVLPVPKVYDQFQPMRFDKIGKIFMLRIRLISTGDTSIPFTIYADASPTLPANTTPLYSSTFSVTPNLDNTYEVDLPKNVNGNILRLTLGPTVSPFHRYDVQVKVATSGMESDSKWIPMR